VFCESETDPLTNGNCDTIDAAAKSSLEKLLYRINPEIDNVATSRHNNGLMSPYICQIFRHVRFTVITALLKLGGGGVSMRR